MFRGIWRGHSEYLLFPMDVQQKSERGRLPNPRDAAPECARLIRTQAGGPRSQDAEALPSVGSFSTGSSGWVKNKQRPRMRRCVQVLRAIMERLAANGLVS